MGLRSDKVELLINQKISQKYDLNQGINDYNEIVGKILHEINEKLIKKVFNDQGKFSKKLKEIKMDGGMPWET